MFALNEQNYNNCFMFKNLLIARYNSIKNRILINQRNQKM